MRVKFEKMAKFAAGIVSQYPKQAPFSVGPDPHVHLKIRGKKITGHMNS